MFLTFSIHHDGELRENPASGYGSVSAMISKDVLMLIQLNRPGIELCQILNMKGATNSSGSVPHMEKFCTLLLPPLQDGACTVWASLGTTSRFYCGDKYCTSVFLSLV